MHAADWDSRYRAKWEAGELAWSKGPNQFVESELSDLPPGRALDLAAGEGRNAIWLAQRGWQVTAVDYSSVALAHGQELAEGAPIAWICADATTWKPTDVFDLVVLSYLQLPQQQRRDVLEVAYQALREGGHLFVIAHHSRNLTEGAGGPQDPEVLYSAEDVLADLAGYFLDVLRADTVTREVAISDDHGGASGQTALDALVHVVKGC